MGGVSKHWADRFLGRGGEEAFQHAFLKEHYWTAEVFDVMSERCDDLIFLDPQEGLRCAEILVAFGARVRDLDSDRGGFAHAVLGSALRKVGRYEAARKSYRKASELVRSGVLKGRVLQRMAVLEWLAKSPEAGLEIVNRSIEFLSGHDLGTSLVIRGSIHSLLARHESSVEDNGLALTLLHVGSRSYFCAVRNLGDSLIELRDVEAIGAVLKLTSKGREIAMGLNRYKRRTPLAYLNWVDGRLYCKLGSHKRAASLLRKAKKSFFSFTGFDHQREALIVSGDLIVALDSMGEFECSISEFQDLADQAELLGLGDLKAKLQLDLKDPSRFRLKLLDLLKQLNPEVSTSG